jgi:hypothetical protein
MGTILSEDDIFQWKYLEPIFNYANLRVTCEETIEDLRFVHQYVIKISEELRNYPRTYALCLFLIVNLIFRGDSSNPLLDNNLEIYSDIERLQIKNTLMVTIQ